MSIIHSALPLFYKKELSIINFLVSLHFKAYENENKAYYPDAHGSFSAFFLSGALCFSQKLCFDGAFLLTR